MKGYALDINNEINLIFLNEQDRNEMALAYREQYIYEQFICDYNLYYHYYENKDYFNPFFIPDGLTWPKFCEKVWTDRYHEIVESVSEYIFCYEVEIITD